LGGVLTVSADIHKTEAWSYQLASQSLGAFVLAFESRGIQGSRSIRA
jgi:hypothetical protein